MQNVQAHKKLALTYLAQAQALLPKVGIDDNPGDGGPDDGKLTRLDMVKVFIGIAKTQDYLKLDAAKKATLAKLQTMVLANGKPVTDCVDEVIAFCRDYDFVSEAIALYKKYNTDGFDADKLIKKAPESQKLGILREALAKNAKLSDISTQAFQYLNLYEAATEAGFREEKKAAQSSLIALLPKILAYPATNLGGVITLCRLYHSGVETGEEAALEKALLSLEKESPGYVGLGLLYLREEGKANKFFALLTDKSHTREFPPRLAEVMDQGAYLALLKRTKNATVALRAALNQSLDLDGGAGDLRLKLMQLAESLEPGIVNAYDWFLFADNFADVKEKNIAQARIRAILKKTLPEQEKYWKSRPNPGAGELSLRQTEWGKLVEVTATADPTFATRLLTRITEPRRRLVTLVALAQAEALASLPKGDLG